MKHSYGLENKILFKIENEIITTIDIFEEIKFVLGKNSTENLKTTIKDHLFTTIFKQFTIKSFSD